MAFFVKKPKIYSKPRKKEIPGGLWTKCPECGELIYTKKLKENQSVCTKCDYHFRLGAYERVDLVADPGTFKELDKNMQSKDPLKFKGPTVAQTDTREQ